MTAWDLAHMTPDRLVDVWALAAPHRPALAQNIGRALTYDELARRSARVARGLSARGVGVGRRVAWWTASRAECVELALGAFKAGAAVVPVNARFTRVEAERQLADARPDLLVVDPAHAQSAAEIARALAGLDVLVLDESPGAADTWAGLPDPPPAAGGPAAAGAGDPRAPAAILYTSGTTGVPKGAVHSHRTLLGWCLTAAAALGWTRGDVVLIPYPMFHMGGLGFVLAALVLGCTAVMVPDPSPAALAQAAGSHRATAMVAPPTIYIRLLADGESADAFSSLTRLAATSAPLWNDTAGAIVRRWPEAQLTHLYSATEAVFSAAAGEELDRHPSSVGQAAWGARVEIRGPGGEPLGGGQQGLVWTQGPSVFVGYLNAPDDVQPEQDGWHTCRDVGYMDAEGFLHLTDRLADVINTGGEKVSSIEVEEVLVSHPGVLEAAVVARPDPLWGQRVHAVVVPNGSAPPPGELSGWCRRRLAGFKVPKTFEFVDALPKNAVGKVRKTDLRETPGSA